MADLVKLEINGEIAVISINNPPVNALSHAVRVQLLAAMDAVETQVRVIVIRAEGRCFSVGADIKEFGQPLQAPSLPELLNRIEASVKPVVAALFGTTLGGGLELALAAHYRIAAPNAQLGLPEVTLGLLPGAGGTQRLPRICGSEKSLSMMLTGAQISATEGVQIGLIDQLAEADLDAAAMEFALQLNAEARRPTCERRDGMQDVGQYQAVITAHKGGLSDSPFLAHGKIVDCVEVALLLPFQAGLAFEAAAFEDCMASDQSAALRHVFIAERRAAKLPAVASASTDEIETVAVLGSGSENAEIAAVLLRGGLQVTVLEKDAATMSDVQGRIAALLDQSVTRGDLSAAERTAQLNQLGAAILFSDLPRVDMMIETAGPDLAQKAEMLTVADAALHGQGILVSSGTEFSTEVLAANLTRKAFFLGFGFASSALTQDLVEVTNGPETSEATLATCFAFLRRLGKWPVLAGNGDGRIVKRITDAYRYAVELMLQEGASPYLIDAAMRNIGFTSGPFQDLDHSGLDRDQIRRQRLADAAGDRALQAPVADMLCEAGWLGRSAWRGYYRYDTSDRAHHDPAVLELIGQVQTALGKPQHKFSLEDVQRCALAAMANAGAALLIAGAALRPSDIDTAMVHGAGFPRWRGGPMQAADQSGLLPTRNFLTGLAQAGERFWQPSSLFDDLIKNGECFGDLNGD